MYAVNLIVLFSAVSVNLAASWTTVEDAFILKDATQGIIASSALNGQLTAAARIIGNSSSLIAVFAGDIILVFPFEIFALFDSKMFTRYHVASSSARGASLFFLYFHSFYLDNLVSLRAASTSLILINSCILSDYHR